jgi:hypothetical protein
MIYLLVLKKVFQPTWNILEQFAENLEIGVETGFNRGSVHLDNGTMYLKYRINIKSRTAESRKAFTCVGRGKGKNHPCFFAKMGTSNVSPFEVRRGFVEVWFPPFAKNAKNGHPLFGASI